MKKRIRIISTVLSLVLVVATLCVGIWAATQVSVTGSGNLSFTGSDVYATVTLESSESSSVTFDSSATKTITFKPGTQTQNNIAVAGLEFTSSDMTAKKTFTVKVKNDFQSDSINVVLTATVEESKPFTASVSESGTATVAAAGEKTFTVTITYTGQASGSDDTAMFNFNLSLTKTATE